MDVQAKNPFFFVPDLEHGYFNTSGNRITLFGDKERWAFVFEKTGYDDRAGWIILETLSFGNCLINRGGSAPLGEFEGNLQFFYLVATDVVCDRFETVDPSAQIITIRNKPLAIEHDPEVYLKKDITLGNGEDIGIVSLTRFLDENNPEIFRATEDELRTMIPDDLPEIMVIDEWHHKSVYDSDGRNMINQETYQLIAEVLASLDASKWQPKLKPNNNWRNWPEAGSL